MQTSNCHISYSCPICQHQQSIEAFYVIDSKITKYTKEQKCLNTFCNTIIRFEYQLKEKKLSKEVKINKFICNNIEQDKTNVSAWC